MEYKFVVQKNEKGSRLDVFLQEKFADSLTRSQIKILIINERVFVNSSCVKAGFTLRENDEVLVNYEKPNVQDFLPEDIKLDIVYEDEFFVVINKPQNMTVHPAGSVRSGTLVNALLHHFKSLSKINGEFRPGIVHRLDKDTSGLIVVAKDDTTHLNLQKQIQNKTCHRIYWAVCYGKFSKTEGTIENFLARGKSCYEKIFVVPAGQGRLAVTNYKVLSYNNGFSLVEFELKTGRTHQIRVHCANMGHPIVGDKLYGRKQEKFDLSGQLLHAKKLVLTHPKSGKKMEFTCSIPDYFEKFLKEHDLIM